MIRWAYRSWSNKKKEGAMSSDKMDWLDTACAELYFGEVQLPGETVGSRRSKWLLLAGCN